MRSGRRRGASEERRGRRPHTSPTRPERNDRQTVSTLNFSFSFFPCGGICHTVMCVDANTRVMSNKKLCIVTCVCAGIWVCCKCMRHQYDSLKHTLKVSALFDSVFYKNLWLFVFDIDLCMCVRQWELACVFTCLSEAVLKNCQRPNRDSKASLQN